MHGKYCNIYYHLAQLKCCIHTVCIRELAQLSFAPLLIPPPTPFITSSHTYRCKDTPAHICFLPSNQSIDQSIYLSISQSISHPLGMRTLIRQSTLLTHPFVLK